MEISFGKKHPLNHPLRPHDVNEEILIDLPDGSEFSLGWLSTFNDYLGNFQGYKIVDFQANYISGLGNFEGNATWRTRKSAIADVKEYLHIRLGL